MGKDLTSVIRDPKNSNLGNLGVALLRAAQAKDAKAASK